MSPSPRYPASPPVMRTSHAGPPSGLAGMLWRANAAFGRLAGLTAHGFRSGKIEALGGSAGGFEAGGHHRQALDWLPRAIGPDATAQRSLGMGRSRARDACRNHPLLAGAKGKLADRVVGTGVVAQPDTEFPEFNRRVADLWKHARETVDPGRERSMGMMQKLVAREIFDGGDALVYLPIVEAWRGLPPGPAVEVLPPEQLPLELSSLAPRKDGSRIRQGVETDALGRRVAYHVMEHNPADEGAGGFFGVAVPVEGGPGVRRISAMDATLAMVGASAGQTRGVPIVLAALMTGKQQLDFIDSGVMQAFLANCLGIVVEGGPVNRAKDADGQIVGPDGNVIERVFPGMVGYVAPGQGPGVHALNPNLPGPSFESTVNKLAEFIGTATGFTYAELTGDYSRTNFAGGQLGRIAFDTFLRTVRDEAIWTPLERPFYRRWLSWMITSGRIDLTDRKRFGDGVAEAWVTDRERVLAASPGYPSTPWTNPQQDARAEDIALANGSMSLGMIAAKRGTTVRRLVEERVSAAKLFQQVAEDEGVDPAAVMPAWASGGGNAGEASREAADRDREREDEREAERDDQREAGGAEPAAGPDSPANTTGRGAAPGGRLGALASSNGHGGHHR